MQQKVNGEIIATGSEIMLGRMVDTNSAWLSDVLGSIGIGVVRHTAVGDDRARIIAAFQKAWADNSITVVTGGLGPTEDDLTRNAASEAFSRKLVFYQNLADELKANFARRGYTFTENNLRQAWLPEGSLLVPNILGTAPGFAIEDGSRLMVFLPGVPQEMKRMIEDWAMPKFKSLYPLSGFRKTVVLKTAGLGESAVDARIGDLMGGEHNPAVGLLAAPDMVRVIVATEGENEEEVEQLQAPVLNELEKRLAGHVFACGDETLSEAVAALLKKSGLKLTILDAITQGRLTSLLGPALAPENWGGAQDMPWQPTLSGVMEILRLYAPDSVAYLEHGEHPPRRDANEIRLIITARPESGQAPFESDEAGLMIESGVHNPALNDGKPVLEKFKVGGTPARALARAASLTVFHLWQILRVREQGQEKGFVPLSG